MAVAVCQGRVALGRAYIATEQREQTRIAEVAFDVAAAAKRASRPSPEPNHSEPEIAAMDVGLVRDMAAAVAFDTAEYPVTTGEGRSDSKREHKHLLVWTVPIAREMAGGHEETHGCRRGATGAGP